MRAFPRYVLPGLIVLIVSAAVTALAAANSVPASRLADRRSAISADALKPAQCGGLNLTTLVTCPSAGGACSGTAGNDLILGSALADDIQGDKGDDCILGGGGDDSFRGDQATDVCIGGPGTDAFHPSCETEIQ
jgi:hypothetical protein